MKQPTTQPGKTEKVYNLTEADIRELLQAKRSDDDVKLEKLIGGLVHAIDRSREPWVDPRKAENEKLMREQMVEATTRQKAEMAYSQQVCEHKQGGNPLSSQPHPTLSSIAMHTMDTGETVGICTVCTRIFSSLINEDRKYLTRRSANSLSSAGIRNFSNPLRAQTARFGKEKQREMMAAAQDGTSFN